MTDAVVVGRVGADLYPTEPRTALRAQRTFVRSVGGSGGNIAVGLRRLGVDTALVTGIGADGHGQFLLDRLEAEGVDTRFVSRHPERLTPISFCELWPPDHFPVTMFRTERSADWEVDLDPASVTALADARLLVVTLTALAREASRASTLALVYEHRGIRLVDLDWRAPVWEVESDYAKRVTDVAAAADLVLGNEEEIARAAGSPSSLLAAGARAVVVKRGPRGATLVTAERSVDVPAIPVVVVNGLGAGDAMAAAIGAALLAGRPLAEAVERGAAAGALVASRLACAESMPTVPELERILRREDDR